MLPFGFVPTYPTAPWVLPRLNPACSNSASIFFAVLFHTAQMFFDFFVKCSRLAAQGFAVMLDHGELLVGELEVAEPGLERNNVLFHLGITTEKVYSN